LVEAAGGRAIRFDSQRWRTPRPPTTDASRHAGKSGARAPQEYTDHRGGILSVIKGPDKPIPMGLVAAAGKRAEDLTVFGVRFDELHRGGWDPQARLADQDRDGVAA